MKLISVQYGDFEEIEHLNPNFQKNFLKLKLTLDMLSPKEIYIENFPRLMFTLIEALPNLRYHQCSHGEKRHLKREYDPSHLISPIKIIGDVIDTVHLLEHTILELQCQISEMDVCSGLTCNYWEPENRFDVFVECTEPNIAIFSSNVAIAALKNIIYNTNDFDLPSLSDTVAIAKQIYSRGITDADELAGALQWSKPKVQSEIKRLDRFNFPFQILQPAA